MALLIEAHTIRSAAISSAMTAVQQPTLHDLNLRWPKRVLNRNLKTEVMINFCQFFFQRRLGSIRDTKIFKKLIKYHPGPKQRLLVSRTNSRLLLPSGSQTKFLGAA